MNDDSRNTRTRLVLLGASNLTRAIGTVVPAAARHLGSPLEIVAALGHGRSYGMRSRVLLRELPGIVQCGLWEALRRQTQLSTLSSHSLITDVGNDIVYGATPEQVAQWVEECVVRLQAIDNGGGRIAMTMLPIEGLRMVTRWQYRIVKSMLFPTRSLTFSQAVDRANDLHDRMVALAQHHAVRMINPKRSWYGFDPIHIRYARWSEAWEFIFRTAIALSSEASPPTSTTLKPSPWLWARLRLLTPQKWWLAGISRGREQPAAKLPDGTTISLY